MTTKAAMNSKGGATIWRYVLTGAGLGLYFGLFFRPLREPSLLLAVLLSVLAAVVTVAFQMVRERRGPDRALVGRFFLTWGAFALGLAVLELRHVAYDVGGKAAVTVMTTAAGMLAGVWYWRRQGR